MEFVEGTMEPQLETQMTAWDFFVLRHRRTGNLVFHFVSALLFFGSPIAALLLWNPWFLVGFSVSGVVGTSGHYLFRDGGVSLRESSAAPEVPYFVVVMFYKLARGSYRVDVAAAETKAAAILARA